MSTASTSESNHLDNFNGTEVLVLDIDSSNDESMHEVAKPTLSDEIDLLVFRISLTSWQLHLFSILDDNLYRWRDLCINS